MVLGPPIKDGGLKKFHAGGIRSYRKPRGVNDINGKGDVSRTYMVAPKNMENKSPEVTDAETAIMCDV